MERTAETRVALLSIIIKDTVAVEKLNEILHIYRDYVIGRMGIPYRERQIQIISVAVDSAYGRDQRMSGKIGRLPGVSSKVAYASES